MSHQILIERNKDGYRLSFSENGRIVASGADKTAKDAARYLLCHMNRLVLRAEQCLVDLGIVSETDCADAAAFADKRIDGDKEKP